ncbi:adenylate/guanylate cyclase domain-containing protein [Spirochaeta lutea]|uniref:Guanylate cyclase domain-containing protein n=1 Tax=Spirochaeta lutea TaxID=1480694 RepID=A0A098QTP5_9SPIO|nr:adenylate/guanylate cyclase domain-containing protein [Spirochaeta lutea]KGE70768.1 hypothetical protein DC28_14830 [Spirochaeta lutea]
MILPKDLLSDSTTQPGILGQNPGLAGECGAHLADYALTHLGIAREDLFHGVSVSRDDLDEPGHWISTGDTAVLFRNLMAQSGPGGTHRIFGPAGRQFRFLPHSSLGALYSLIPAGEVVRDISAHVSRVTQFFQAECLAYSRSGASIVLGWYPQALELFPGPMDMFIQGLLTADLQAQGYSVLRADQAVFGFDLEMLIHRAYGHQGWKTGWRDDVLFLQGSPLARRISCTRRELELRGIPCTPRESELRGIGGGGLGDGRAFQGGQGDSNARSIRCLEVLRDVFLEDQVVFRAGEIYNAPFSRIDFVWRQPGLISRLVNSRRRRRGLPKLIQELQSEVARGTERYFEMVRLHQTTRQQSKIFRMYTKDGLAQGVDSGDDPTLWLPQGKELAVLFCDIRNFTQLSERLSAKEVVGLLNTFFRTMNDRIREHRGDIDKLMGDCLMAQFESVDQAVDAAVAMEKALQDLNRDRIARELPRLDIGIGISFGPVVQGNIGSHSRMDYTIVGDTVNVASRLESLTRHYKVRCIISEDVLNRLEQPRTLRFIDRVQVKGKALPVSIYEVYDADPDWVKAMKQRFQPRYDLAYRVYKMGDFHRAVSLYAHIYREVGPHSLDTELSADPVVLFYIDRCRELRDQVDQGALSPERWGGVYRFLR